MSEQGEDSRGGRLLRRSRRLVELVWATLNSPLVIALVSGLLISEVARQYASRETERKDLVDRRGRLVLGLAELQQRVSYLQAADRTWRGRCDYLKAAAREWDVINGAGRYVPTSPAYGHVHLNVVINDVETSSGVADIRFGTALWMGAFSVPPPRTAWFVRTQLEWLAQYGSGRSFLLGTGALPLRDGVPPDEFVNTLLELPGSTPALRAKLEREVNEHVDRLDAALRRAEAHPKPACREPPSD